MEPGHDRDDCITCQTDRILDAIETVLNNQGEIIMASIADIQAKLDQLTTQEAGESTMAPGQVAVAQSDLDALDAHVQSLIDNPPPPAPAPSPSPAPPTA